MNPTHPIYVISKGRAATPLTARALDRIGVPFRMVVEPQERDEYAAVVGVERVIVLPFSNLGRGSIPARNFVWEHAIGEGHARHWILDDNIRRFHRFNRNLKVPVASGTIFRAAEQWCDRYENVGLAGFEYHGFIDQRTKYPSPVRLNARIYSCILVDNALPFRWRGRYNEDTDLSLRVLKSGRCTALFLAFLAQKVGTMTMKGGNTAELYAGDGRLKMAQSLQRQHPDVTTIRQRWGRWQHVVDYSRFRDNQLKPRAGVTIPDGVDDLGMTLRTEESP